MRANEFNEPMIERPDSAGIGESCATLCARFVMVGVMILADVACDKPLIIHQYRAVIRKWHVLHEGRDHAKTFHNSRQVSIKTCALRYAVMLLGICNFRNIHAVQTKQTIVRSLMFAYTAGMHQAYERKCLTANGIVDILKVTVILLFYFYF
jgi:hypothetical protein